MTCLKSHVKHHVVLALLCIVFTSESRGQLPNAWQINDNSESGGSLLNYITNITSAQKIAATNSGWRFAITSRLVTDYGDVGSMFLIVGDGTRRYGLALDLNGAGQLTASLLGGATITLVADAAAATNYHVHQLTFDPTSGNATYEMDGQSVVSWAGQVSTAQTDTVLWGSSASGGRSQMNFHRVEFEVAGQGVIASYSAGLDGNPAVAPDPTTQGWMRSAGATVIPEGPVSPDELAVPLLAVTRAAADVSNDAATLNGWIGHDGLPTDYYFEYGTTTGYGSVTVTNKLTANTISAPVSLPLTGLEPGKLYHYRIVASNDDGMATGDDATFATYSFSEVTLAGLQDVDTGSVSWVDYDNDGLLDFLVTGHYLDDAHRTVSQLWRNTGDGFTDVTATVAPGLPQVRYSDVAWGDYDNDGRVDFLLLGSTNGLGLLDANVTQLWRNTAGGFVNVTDIAFPPDSLPTVSSGAVDWGDYDNDGRLDFLICGIARGPYRYTQLWRNTGSGFVNVTDSMFPPDGLPGVSLGSVSWGDYDNDGRLDFLIMGTYFVDTVEQHYITQLWRNTGAGFVNVTETAAPGLPEAYWGCVQWVDFNQDGLLDFHLTGNQMGPTSQLWQNTGEGFTNVTDSVAPGLPSGGYGSDTSVAWGDYDNDGLIDFMLTGSYFESESGLATQLWRNTGGSFTNVTGREFPAGGLAEISYSSVAWGDYDNDGRLDLLLAGSTTNVNSRYVTRIWKNNTIATNTPPTAPAGLAMTMSSNGAFLSWNEASDAQTPSAGLTYNVRAGSTPGGVDLLAAQVDAATGFRRVPASGNAQLRRNLPLSGVTNGQTVYWSVQAVDTTFAGGPFASETSMVSQPQLAITPGDATSAMVSWMPPTFGWHLEEAPSLNPAAWVRSSSDELNPVTLSATNGAAFYRLRDR